MRVRAAASDAELNECAALLDAFNREFEEPTPGPAVLGVRLRAMLDGGLAVVLLARERAGEPAVGLALVATRADVWEDGPVGVLAELYVVPDRRSRGTGAALLAAAESTLRNRGGSLMEIPVDAGDRAARRFYEREHYRVVGAQRTYTRTIT